MRRYFLYCSPDISIFDIITNGIFIFLQVALKLHALDVQVLLLSQWRLRSSLIDTLEMGAANLK
jgi:hypothetical protein